ncbi:Histone deacetylase HDT2 [Rhynchospora pubera]|uniref:Histone deacetylase HDT2 n=1 Tax=Rhynchospora pubera TaxID=906938 RepID=A0AAV8GTB3_9POAL|nr:Histone deacetylase HDT2 [Rhynchospora pubera]
MEFWGVEVKPGETVKCDPEENRYIHLSQASLGETKKSGESVMISVKCDDRKLVVGTLSAEKCAQIQYDVVFEKEFELSHNSKNASVHFVGYKTFALDGPDDDIFDGDMSDESEEEDEPVEAVPIKAAAVNGKPKVGEKAKVEEKAKAEGSKKPKAAEKPKVESDDDNDDSDEDDDDDSDEDDEDDSDEEPKELKMMEVDDEDDDDDDDEDDDEDDDDEDDSDDEEEATPQKDSKKRPLKDGQKTPGQENKKAKLVSPAGAQKTDGKKGGHVATPHPAKQVPKTPAANNDKSKQKPQTPKSGGSVACKSCSKTFNSETALQSHTKAKHA